MSCNPASASHCKLRDPLPFPHLESGVTNDISSRVCSLIQELIDGYHVPGLSVYWEYSSKQQKKPYPRELIFRIERNGEMYNG